MGNLRLWAALVTIALAASLLSTLFQEPSPAPKLTLPEDAAKPTERPTEVKPAEKAAEKIEQPAPKQSKQKTAKKAPQQVQAWQPDCQAPKNHDEADFCQQRRMAAAAERGEQVAREQLQVVRDQYWLSWPLLAALVGTLVATACAAHAASRSAKAAERALVDLERPIVFVEVPQAGLVVEGSDGRFSLAGGCVTYQCVNYGRTPALLTEYHPTFLILEKGCFPDPVDPSKERGRELPVGCVSAQDAPYAQTEAPMKTFPAKLLEPGAVEKYSIYFIGYVRYTDIHGGRYINGFCFLYDWIGGKFVRRGDNQYNYTKNDVGPGGGSLA